MEQAINCLKENCNGVLEEGIRGFFKCTVCGAKVKKSLIEKATTTIQQAQVIMPLITQQAQSNISAPMPPVLPVDQQVVAQAINMVEQASREVSEIAKNKVESVPKTPKPKTTTQKVTTNDGVYLVGKTMVIKCVDCGGDRTIKVQDAFQVKRCVNCQKNYSKARRAEKAKAKRSATPTV